MHGREGTTVSAGKEWHSASRIARVTFVHRLLDDSEPQRMLRDSSLRPDPTMSVHEELAWLDQTETELADIADAVQASTGIERRDFLFWSLVTAAASTLDSDRVCSPKHRRPPPKLPKNRCRYSATVNRSRGRSSRIPAERAH